MSDASRWQTRFSYTFHLGLKKERGYDTVSTLYSFCMLDSSEALLRNAVDLLTREAFLKRLQEKKTLKIKAGFDPTRPDLHFGHWVLLKKMRQFQDLGHEVVLIVGDFTALIGDPSGKNKARPKLSHKEVRENAKTYTTQAFKILDKKKTDVRFNSEWLSQLKSEEVHSILSKVTTDQILQRRDFRLRLDSRKDIFLHELIYPVLQGYDSVVVRPDIELGGTDQLFNLLMGREMMESWGMQPQIVMTMPLLVGTDARYVDGAIQGPKMSKSLDNYIGLLEDANSIKNKICSLDVRVACEYARLLSNNEEILRLCAKTNLEKTDALRSTIAEDLLAELSTH